MRYSELIENTDSDDDLFAKPLADRIRDRLAELEDQDMMEPEDMIDTVAEEFNLDVEQVYDLLDDEVYENTDDDDDLFGGRDRESLTAEKAVTKFKMFFPINKRVSWSKMHFGTVERLFGFTSDSRFHAGRAVNRNEYWGTQAYTNRQTGLGMLVYEDSDAGTWVYLGANDRNDFARMIQQMIEAGQLEDPEAAKKRRVEKQQRRAATIEKKGLRVGSIIDIGYNDIKAEVIEIKPTTGKVVMRDITGANIGTERTWSAYQLKKSQIIGENTDDDDLFATPKIAFNDVFNEYDEDQLMAQGFQYGDHPEQDIEILNNYLEDYKDFRVVDISGGEHDLILHLDRSSRLRETDDDELFGESVNKKIAKWLHNYAVRMQQEPNYWSAFSADEGDEYQNDIAEIREQGEILQSIAQTFATEGLREGLRVFGYRAHEYDNWWWDRIAPELNDETGISLEDLVDEINIGESENPDHNDDELFGTTSFNADRAGKLIATANITSGELVDPESIQHALEHAANRVMNSPVVQKKAADQLQKWMAMDNDAQWELVDEIANVVYDINGDGWEPEEDPYYDRANESADDDDDELFAQKWHERINMRSIEIDGVDRNDYPDFADAYVSYAQYKNGKPMDELELERLNNYLIDNGKLNELVWDSLYEDGHAL